ncbi:MAG: hypothetical protein DRP42_07905 [Tenericutes bacterium]|nr:MAG: hypothetical protein DRP42_07905 [Mycoplasmatota bacterium]
MPAHWNRDQVPGIRTAEKRGSNPLRHPNAQQIDVASKQGRKAAKDSCDSRLLGAVGFISLRGFESHPAIR